MNDDKGKTGGIGLIGALSIGMGGIVGGGFFATFGIAVAGAKGATPISFLLAGAIALVTAYSCVLFGLSSFFGGRANPRSHRDKMRSAATGGLGRSGPLR
jgi:amino acid transporter